MLSSVGKIFHGILPLHKHTVMSRLSRREMDLVGADAIYKHTLNELDKLKSPIAEELRDSLSSRIDHRRIPVLSQLANFLDDNSYINQKEDVFGHPIDKKNIRELAAEIHGRLWGEPENEETQMVLPAEEEFVAEFFEDSSEGLSNGEKLDFLLNKIKKGRSQTKSQKGVSQNQTEFEQELSRYERLGEMSASMEQLCEAIKSIRVSSVEAERVFSVSGSVVTKIRTRLGDETVNNLVFLKKYYGKKH